MRYLRAMARRSICRLFLSTPMADERWQDAVYKQNSFTGRSGTLALDIGSGPSPRNPFCCEVIRGVDIRPGPNVIEADLSSGLLPCDSASVDAVTAYDLLEHIPRVLGASEGQGGVRLPFVELMNELHRCLKPGGLFFSSTPCFPWPMAFQDPTHVNIMTEETLRSYFCGPAPGAAIYGFKGRFVLKSAAWIGGHYTALLVRPSE